MPESQVEVAFKNVFDWMTWFVVIGCIILCLELSHFAPLGL